MATQEQSKEKKKRRLPVTLLWGLLGLVILLAGVASALYYMNRERIAGDSRLRVIQDFVSRVDRTIERGKSTLGETLQRGKSMAGLSDDGVGKDSGDDGAMGDKMVTMTRDGSRVYIVKPGENLWAIARESDLVDNPWEWRTILLQNADKIEYAFISEEGGSWMVMMAEGQELSVSDESRAPEVPGDGKKFAFQLASMSDQQLERAVQVARILMRDGYYAYLYPHEQDGKLWYRIRSGFYDSEAKAKSVGEAIRQRYTKQHYFPDKLWVIEPSAAEMAGEDMVFGAQLMNPWVAELDGRDSHRQALTDLRKATNSGHFAYILQSRNPITRRFVYKVRIGFFNSEAQAQDVFAGQTGEVWEGAKAVKIDQFEETLPGQFHKLGNVANL